MIGISMGEIFYLKDLAADCALDQRLRILFLRPATADYQGGWIARESYCY